MSLDYSEIHSITEDLLSISRSTSRGVSSKEEKFCNSFTRRQVKLAHAQEYAYSQALQGYQRIDSSSVPSAPEAFSIEKY